MLNHYTDIPNKPSISYIIINLSNMAREVTT